MNILDFYENDGRDKQKIVLESIKEIDEKLKKEKDGKERTKLMYEQLLRGLYLSQCPDYMG